MNSILKKFSSVVLVCFISISISAQKQIYIPTTFNAVGADDYCNKYGNNGTIHSIDDLVDENERWSKSRSYETDNLICFWEPGFGDDVTKLKNPANTSQSFDLTPFVENLDDIFNFQIDEMHATYADGEKLNTYKYLILLSYTNDWIAYGGGYDYVIGSMWVNPAALGVGSNNYFTLTHELFHAMSYQCYSDRPSNDYMNFQDPLNGPFWERSANHAAMVTYPNTNSDFARYMYANQSHFLNTRKQYTTSFLLEHLDETFGISSLGELWKNNRKNEHAVSTIRRIFFEDEQAKINDYMGKTAMKNMTWDYPTGSNGAYHKTIVNSINYNTDATGIVDEWNIIQKKHRTILYAIDYQNRHFAVRDNQAPQDYGYNAIQIFPETVEEDGSATFKMRFRGHTEQTDKKPGWRWGFVAIQEDGLPRYGTLYGDSDKTVSFTKNATDKEVWLIVTGAPQEHTTSHNYTWEAGFTKYYRYPYEVRFENAVPMGYNEDYEGNKTNGAPHPNGGGWVASTATVEESAYVGPNAKVLGNAQVRDNARIEDFAIIKGSSQIYGNAVVKENAMVFTNSKVYGNAIVSGSARVLNNSEVYDDAFVTDNAFICRTKVYGNAIACGNLWQRDNTCEIGGTCVAGGDNEYAGYISEGAEISGTYLLWPEYGNNGRNRHDGLGNLSVERLTTLKENWNDIPARYDILNSTHSSNAEINGAYTYFSTSDMALGKVIDDEEFAVINQGSYVSVTGTIPSNTSYRLFNDAGIDIQSGDIKSAVSIGIPSKCPSGKYVISLTSDQGDYCEVINK